MKLSERIALNSSVQVLRQVLLAITGIVSVAVATRYLSVDEYGGIVAALVLLSLFSFATDFGISAMTVRAMARDPDHEVAIQSSAFWVWVAFSAPTALLILAISQLAYPGSEGAVTRESVLVLMSTFPLMPLAGAAQARATADQRVWVTSIAGIFARCLSLLAVILAAAFDLGPLGIATAFAAGFVLEQVLTILFVRPRIELRAGLHRGRIWSLVVAAVPLGMVMVINGLYFRLDAFLLSVLGSQGDVAVYGVAYKAFESVLAFPGFVMVTLLPVLSRLEFDHARYQELVQKAFTAMVLISLPIFGFAVLGGPAMEALGGPKYADGGPVLALIMMAVGIACLQGVFGNALVTQGRQGILLRVSVTILVANGLLNLAAIPPFGDTGAAAALLVTEVLSLAMTLFLYRRFAPLPRLESPKRFLLALAAMVAVATAALALPTAALSILVGGGLGLLAYVGALAATGAMPDFVSRPLVSLLRSLRPGGRR